MRQSISFSLQPSLDNVPLAGVSAKAMGGYLGLSPEDAAAFELALVEALNNCIEHGMPSTNQEVTVDISFEDSRLSVKVAGAGPEFRPPDEARLPGNLSEGGYGLFILDSFADNLEWSRKGNLNCLFFSKKLPTPPSA